jgi:nucleoside-diphosphate-sugar epimerase
LDLEPLEGKKVLITGSTGFIGANLARRCLKSGSDVYIMSRSTSDRWRIKDILAKVKDYKADLSDYERLETVLQKIRPDIVYHTAVYGGNSAQKDFRMIVESNLIGTANLINACKKVDLELFVNTGSSSEYGVKAAPMREDEPLGPVNDYGFSKAAATLYCQAAARNEGLPIVTLRLFSPYGSYEGPNRLISSAILACLRGENPRVSSLSFVRDFVFINDVLDAYLKVVEAPNVSEKIFNIGSGEQHSVGDVVDTVIKLTGKEVIPVIGAPQRWKSEPAMWQADISRARKHLGWSPRHNLEQGLTATIEWFQENKALYY